MPISFYKYSKNIVTSTKLQFFRISGIFPTCFGCFLSANTADQKHVDLQKFHLAIFLQYSKPQVHVLVIETKTSKFRDWDSTNGKSWDQDQISRLHHWQTCSGETNILCSKCNVHLCLNQWWSLETHFCESRSRRLQVSRLWALQRNSVVLKFRDFLFVMFAGKKQPNMLENTRNLKKSTQKWWRHSKQKFGKMLKFWSLESRFQISSLESLSFWWSRSRSFNQVSVSKVTFSTASLV